MTGRSARPAGALGRGPDERGSEARGRGRAPQVALVPGTRDPHPYTGAANWCASAGSRWAPLRPDRRERIAVTLSRLSTLDSRLSIHALTHSRTHALTHSRTHALTHSRTHALAASRTGHGLAHPALVRRAGQREVEPPDPRDERGMDTRSPTLPSIATIGTPPAPATGTRSRRSGARRGCVAGPPGRARPRRRAPSAPPCGASKSRSTRSWAR